MLPQSVHTSPRKKESLLFILVTKKLKIAINVHAILELAPKDTDTCVLNLLCHQRRIRILNTLFLIFFLQIDSIETLVMNAHIVFKWHLRRIIH